MHIQNKYKLRRNPFLFPDVCVYKGKQYNQDQKWQDGCDFDCVCQDSKKGLYKCTEKYV